MDDLLALIAFSFVSSVTPGPNNILLWASGAQFGLRRTMPHVLGTSVGIGAMALAVAAGIDILVTTVPAIATVMKVGGSIYLLYLAWQIAGVGALERTAVARPLSLVQGAAFQLINPKAWVFALGAITTFRPPGFPPFVGGVLVAAVMMVVIVPSAALWAGAGGVLSRWTAGARAGRIVSVTLAIVLVLTVVYVWL